MAAVKGSRQYEMVIVPHRPWYKAGILCLFVLALVAFSALTYQYGMGQGLATRVEVVRERDDIKSQLIESQRTIERMRQENADLKVGGQIDSRATEEVRQTVESLQNEIAELNEEIRFYKGVMLPSVEEKGLRIERLNVKSGGGAGAGQYRYSLLLTQVVEKHEYIQGSVQISLVGVQNSAQVSLPLGQISEAATNIKFRFRYFQNIDGQLTIPTGFVPKEFLVVAQTGDNGLRIEKKFHWQTGEG